MRSPLVDADVSLFETDRRGVCLRLNVQVDELEDVASDSLTDSP